MQGQLTVNSVRATAPSVGPDCRGGACMGGRWGLKVEAKEDGCEHVPLAFSRTGQGYSGPLGCPEEEVQVVQYLSPGRTHDPEARSES